MNINICPDLYLFYIHFLSTHNPLWFGVVSPLIIHIALFLLEGCNMRVVNAPYLRQHTYEYLFVLGL